MCMGGTCSIIGGVVVLLSGLSFAGVLGTTVVGMAAGVFGGWLFALYGLALLVHGLNMCPMCKK